MSEELKKAKIEGSTKKSHVPAYALDFWNYGGACLHSFSLDDPDCISDASHNPFVYRNPLDAMKLQFHFNRNEEDFLTNRDLSKAHVFVVPCEDETLLRDLDPGEQSISKEIEFIKNHGSWNLDELGPLRQPINVSDWM